MCLMDLRGPKCIRRGHKGIWLTEVMKSQLGKKVPGKIGGKKVIQKSHVPVIQ